ncbi:hypothetical protein [Halopiger xanaduensis]|uniref:DUF5658 domain-containing protein n=1 Tax=Halopiger xanaduensis (strain DSM 18323 / JCM 14033 / SH-6) TaxID=797210 RepID=F8DBE5_HALXS|nr:hypothetical protein [Halopiger xanaduensis]AEH37060.1 hypothetical protein Halxa_2441 [Halopiger xanaduensis SH-6]
MSTLVLVLWLLAVLFYGVGDLVTTVVGTRTDGLEEGQPLTRAIFGEQPSALQFGLFKVGVLLAFYGVFLLLPDDRFRPLVPAAILGVGIGVVVHNIRAIRSVR